MATVVPLRRPLDAAPLPTARDWLKIVIVGHVDHGKSTLVGRLLHDTDSLPEGKLEAIRASCEKRGVSFQWAFLMDALQAERDQGITIDTSQIMFRSARRRYVIIDAPGHKEFLKNMITGASQAEAAVVVIDALEGVQAQSRRHGYLLHLLGLKQIVVVVNKMDLVGHDQARFDALALEYRAYLSELGLHPSEIVPIIAKNGDNIVERSSSLDWYQGPTLLEALDRFQRETLPLDQPLRLPVQDVYKFDDKRIIAGRVETGRIGVGDRIVFTPSGKSAHVRSIEIWGTDGGPAAAQAGQSIGITLDDQLFIERGETLSHIDRRPSTSRRFRARIFWLGEQTLSLGHTVTGKFGTRETDVSLEAIERLVDTSDLSARESAASVSRSQVADVIFVTSEPIALDTAESVARTGRFVLVSGYDIAGGGIILSDAPAEAHTTLVASRPRVAETQRASRFGHRGGIVWLTGLSGAGKSTLARRLEERLFAAGWNAVVLDGDNLRLGLNSDLDFSAAGRTENVRRTGEVASLFAEAGFIAIGALISPYRADRVRLAEKFGPAFAEVYVKADLTSCEARDPKGHYRRVREGTLERFTGFDSPYEPPERPALVLDTDAADVEANVELLLRFVHSRFGLSTPSIAPQPIVGQGDR
jgi:bifunctional enzyme CysN/CysC